MLRQTRMEKQAMNGKPERLSFRCPKCDHPVVTVPANYHIKEPLICPGCGEELEIPEGLLDAAEGEQEE